MSPKIQGSSPIDRLFYRVLFSIAFNVPTNFPKAKEYNNQVSSEILTELPDGEQELLLLVS
jgi:hypothetical protein